MALTEERQEETVEHKPSRAARVIEGLGIAGAVGTIALGLLGTLPEHPEFEVGREVFGNIPAALQVVFYIGVAVFIWLMAHLFATLEPGRQGLWAETSDGLAERLLNTIRPGDAVMIKGSLGSRMAPLVEVLKTRFAPL